MVTREIPQQVIFEDGSIAVVFNAVEVPLPKMERVFLYEDGGSPVIGADGEHKYELIPVTEEVEEEYEEFAEPKYEDVLVLKAGSRHGIRYDQAIILKQKQIERDHGREIADLKVRIEALEGKA